MLALLGLCLVSSCDKDHAMDMFMSTGKDVSVSRPVTSYFTGIYLRDDVDLVITSGEDYAIRLTGGTNVLEGIETSVSDSVLTISNHNRYNWVRSYDRKITAYVSLPHLLKLNYEATGTVTCTDTIREDSLFVTAQGGSGYINLLISTRLSHLSITRGSADINVSGKSNVNFIFADGYGPFNCKNLWTAFTFMHTESTNDCYINVTHHLEYDITNLGNIYYRGHPDVIKGTDTGKGELIPLD